MHLISKAPSSICILRLSAVGDVCNAVAMVQALQRRWPDSRITWVTGTLESQLIKDLPGIEVIAFDKKQGLAGYLNFKKTLQGRRFEVLLHMQAAIRASLLSLLIPAKIRLGFDKARAKDLQWLFTNHKIGAATSPHVLDGFMQFAKELGVIDPKPSWQFPISSADQAWAKTQISSVKSVMICPATSKTYKNWTVDGYAALAKHAASAGFQVLLCGGPAAHELALAEQIQRKSQVECVNLTGKSSLTQLLALIREVSLLLSPDTGPAHMASAVNTPVLGLYAHHNPKRTGPYNSQGYIVSAYDDAIKAETGKSSEQLPWRARVKDPKAMERITVESVKSMFDHLITVEGLT